MMRKKTQDGRMRPEGRKVRQGILGLLEGRDLPPDGRLPSLKELGSRFGVSYASVSRAIGRLRDEGRVVVFDGKGVFAVRPARAGTETRRQVTLGPALADLLAKSDIRALRRLCPETAIEVATDPREFMADFGLVDAESILSRTHRGQQATAASLGFGVRDGEALNVEPAVLAQLSMDGELKGLPVAVNPLLAGVCRRHSGEAGALKNRSGRIPFERLADFASRHTRDSDREGGRVSGFDFVNHTLHTHALCRAGGADLESLGGFYGGRTRAVLRRLWELIHRDRTCLALISSATPVTRLDLWKLDRVVLLFAAYAEVSSLFQEPRAFAEAGRELLEWGGESARYLTLGARFGVSPTLYRALAGLLTSPRLQTRLLRRGWGLPATRSAAVWKKAERLLGRNAAPLRRIVLRAHNPWRHDGSPEAFWYAEYAMRDYLADLCRLDAKDVAAIARRRDWTLSAARLAVGDTPVRSPPDFYERR